MRHHLSSVDWSTTTFDLSNLIGFPAIAEGNKKTESSSSITSTTPITALLFTKIVYTGFCALTIAIHSDTRPGMLMNVFIKKRVGLLSLQQQQDLQNLDQKVQTITESLARGPKSFDELKILVHNESESIKQHITNEVQRHERDLAHDVYHRRYLGSLWYPEIKHREETIKEAHARTFRWIFEPDVSDKAVRRWHSFVEWLASGQGTYWISGKAGSGKSTLMNCIH